MNSRLLAVLGGIVIILLILAYSSLFVVEQIEQAIVLQFGKPVRLVTEPGLDIKLPYPLQDLGKYERRVLDFEPPAEEVTAADQKRLVVDTYARFRIADPLLFYQSVGTEVVARTRLSSIMTGAMEDGKLHLKVTETVGVDRSVGISRMTSATVTPFVTGIAVDWKDDGDCGGGQIVLNRGGVR